MGEVHTSRPAPVVSECGDWDLRKLRGGRVEETESEILPSYVFCDSPILREKLSVDVTVYQEGKRTALYRCLLRYHTLRCRLSTRVAVTTVYQSRFDNPDEARDSQH